MSSAVPRDIARKLEQRWSARFKQAETFQARAERLKQSHPTLVEGVRLPDQTPCPEDEIDDARLAPPLSPND